MQQGQRYALFILTQRQTGKFETDSDGSGIRISAAIESSAPNGV